MAGEDSALFGRERERAQVAARIDAAVAGRPSLLLCRGEPGIGKTRLVEVALGDAASQPGGPEVVWVRAPIDGGAPPFSLWRQVWRTAGIEGGFRQIGEDDLAGHDRFALFAGATDELVARAAARGIVLALDDLHAADEASLSYLVHLVDTLRPGDRVCLVATARPVPGGGAWPAISARLIADPRVELLELGGVDGPAVAAILASTGLREPDEATAARVTAHTGGNPFYVREVGRALAVGPDDDRRPPPSVVELVRRRIATLDPLAQDVLRAAAVAGDGVPVAVVAEVVGTTPHDCLPALESAADAGLLARPSLPATCRFVHALVADATLAGMPVDDRVRRHARMVEAIETTFATDLEPQLAELARHAVAAVPILGAARAATACERAADAAMAALAFESAESRYREAREVGVGVLEPSVRVRLLLAQAAAAERGGRAAGALACVEEAAATARNIEDAVGVARAALVLTCTGQAERDHALLALTGEALASDALPVDVRIRVAARHAEALVYLGERTAGAESADALRAARDLGDPRVLLDALQARQLASATPEGLDERIGLATEMLTHAAQLGDARAELLGRLWTIDALMEQGRLHEAAAELPALAIAAARVGGPAASWHASTTRAAVYQAQARFDEAVSTAREAFELLMATGETAAFGAYMALTQTVAHHVGFDGEAAAARPPAPPPGIEADARTTLFEQLAPSFVLADSGRVEDAAAAYRSLPPAEEWQPMPSLRTVAWAMGVHVAAAVGALDDLRVLRAQLAPWRERFAAGSAGQGNTFGPVTLLLGIAAAALGDLDGSVAELEAAVETCDRRGAPGFAVEARTCLAEVLARRAGPGDGEEARSLAKAAAGDAARLGMQPFVRRLGVLGAVTPSAPAGRPSSPTGSASHPLSARELEVALLVAEGLTNRAVADRLFISERTAENHLLHIRTKLGLNNRSQITRWVGRHLG